MRETLRFAFLGRLAAVDGARSAAAVANAKIAFEGPRSAAYTGSPGVTLLAGQAGAGAFGTNLAPWHR